MQPSNPHHEKFDAIAEAFSTALRRGEQPSVDAEVARHGDPSGELRSLLESILMIEGLKKSSTPGTRSNDKEALGEIQQLDDYKIIGPIGRGGMGVVFEAIHQPLSRRVALKVLATNALEESKNLERFRREARAAAQLRHSSIVPVFGVGHASGFHYYVMDLIHGISVREWIHQRDSDPSTNPTIEPVTVDERVEQTAGGFELQNLNAIDQAQSSPTANELSRSTNYWRWVARHGAAICDALQYAHEQGVMHRDIKPANLLIDRDDQIWIADFGLAKIVEQNDLTATGDLVGTPQYMSPESLEGNYDVRSEVYCVGLTLYELLTGRPAIEGRTTAEVIRSASRGVNVPPRKITPNIPRDLETIIMRSLAIDPAKRYSSAGALRDDLERYLSDRPIEARRTGPLERALRWSRREPAAAAMTVSTFLLLLALAAVSAIGYWRTRESLKVASEAGAAARQSLAERTEALEQAETQRSRAEDNLQVALEAFDQVMQNVTNRGVHADADFLSDITDRTTPNVTPDDARMLQSLLGFLDQLATNNSEDLLSESALAARRIGDVYTSLGMLREADRAYTDAFARYEEMAEKHPDDPLPPLAQAEVMNELAAILSLRGQLGRAMDVFGETVTILESSQQALQSPKGAFEYARAHRIYASLSTRVGLDDSIPIQRPTNFRFKRSPLAAMMRIRSEQELTAADEAIKTLEKLLTDSPDDSRAIAELARAYRIRSRVSLRTNQRFESERSIRRSIELFEQLLRDNPKSEDVRYELAMTLSSTEAIGWNQSRRARRADDLSRSLLESHPDQNRYLALRARALETLAKNHQSTGDVANAEASLEEAISHYQRIVDSTPELRVYATYLATTLEAMADLQLKQRDRESARRYLLRALSVLRPKSGPQANSPLSRMQLQRIRQKLERISPTS